MGELRGEEGGGDQTIVRTPPASPRNTRVPGGPELLLGFSIFILSGEWGIEDWVVELISGGLEEPGEMSGL